MAQGQRPVMDVGRVAVFTLVALGDDGHGG